MLQDEQDPYAGLISALDRAGFAHEDGIDMVGEPGVCVRDRKWGGRYTGTIVRVDDDGDLFVQWHGTCVEDQVRPDEVEPIDMPNPPNNGQRLLQAQAPAGRR